MTDEQRDKAYTVYEKYKETGITRAELAKVFYEIMH